MEDVNRRVSEERARVEAEYRRVLKSSVDFERGIRDRWRDKARAKNQRIAELEAQVADLKRRLGKSGDL
jgi:polyhydroxyalkanoate synthesis regulator phasin